MALKDWKLVLKSKNGWNHGWNHEKKNMGVESVKYNDEFWQFEVMENARAIERERVKTKSQSMILARKYMRTH